MVYLDDILIFNKSWNEHLYYVQWVLQTRAHLHIPCAQPRGVPRSALATFEHLFSRQGLKPSSVEPNCFNFPNVIDPVHHKKDNVGLQGVVGQFRLLLHSSSRYFAWTEI